MRPIVIIGVLLLTGAGLHAETLNEILSRMDSAARDFRSFSASMKRTEFTAVINDSADSTGVVRLKKGKNGTLGIVEFTEPDPRTLHFDGRAVEIYYPKAKTLEVYDAGKHTNTLDSFVLLGFGSSGVDLRKSYDVALAGVETVAGTRTSRLELTPKLVEVKKMVTKIELWIPEGQSNPVQEKITQPSKNYSLIIYSNLKLNPPLPDSAFDLAVPAGIKKIYPQR